MPIRARVEPAAGTPPFLRPFLGSPRLPPMRLFSLLQHELMASLDLVASFIARWSKAEAAERANYALFLAQL